MVGQSQHTRLVRHARSHNDHSEKRETLTKYGPRAPYRGRQKALRGRFAGRLSGGHSRLCESRARVGPAPLTAHSVPAVPLCPLREQQGPCVRAAGEIRQTELTRQELR